MTGQHAHKKAGVMNAMHTLWGKCLSVLVALAFVISTMGIAPSVYAQEDAAEVAAEALHEDRADTSEIQASEAAGNSSEEGDAGNDALPPSDPADVDSGAHDASDGAPAQEPPTEDATVSSNEEIVETPEAQAASGWVDFKGNVSLPMGAIKTVNGDKNTYASGTVFSFCTSKNLPSVTISTGATPALGTETGVDTRSLLGSNSTVIHDGNTYAFTQVKIQTTTDGQVGGNYKDKSATTVGTTASKLRYNDSAKAWQYLVAGTSNQWVSLKSNDVFIFYYSQKYDLMNENKYEDSSVVEFFTEDWGNPGAPSTSYYTKTGQGVAIVQLYDANGNAFGNDQRIYYYAACANKKGCSFSAGEFWDIEEVAMTSTEVAKIKPGSDASTSVGAPSSFDALTPVEDKNNFIIPFREECYGATGSATVHDEKEHNVKHDNVFIIGVKVKAKASAQNLTVNYYDAETRYAAQKVSVAESQGVRAAAFSGSGAPHWDNFITVSGNKVSINEGHGVAGNDCLISVPTDLMNHNQTVSLKPADLDANFISAYSEAELVGGNVLNLYFDKDVIGNDPKNPGDTDHSDGIADKYQTLVTYGAVGGTLAMTSSTGVVVKGKTQFDHVVTLFDEQGDPAVNGSYTLQGSDVPEGTRATELWGDAPVWEKLTGDNTTPVGEVIDRESNAHFIAYWGNGFICYYYDGELGSSIAADKAIGEAIEFDTTMSSNKSREYQGHRYALDFVEVSSQNDDVEFVRTDDELVSLEVVKGDPDNNVIAVHYSLDELGNDPSEPGDIGSSDSTPDKYQAVVSYGAEGGTVGGKTQFDHVVTLKDASGNNAADGTYALTDEDVPATAVAKGFAGDDPVWTNVVPEGVIVDKDGASFVAHWGNGYISYYFDDEYDRSDLADVAIGDAIEFDVEANETATRDGVEYVLERVENNGHRVVMGDPGNNVVSVYYASPEPEIPAPVEPEDPTPTDPEPEDPTPTDPEPEDPTPTPIPGEDPTVPPTDNPVGAPGETLGVTETPGAAAGLIPAVSVEAAAPEAAPEAIADDGNPLFGLHAPDCWTHWLMILGALITLAYTLSVLYRRRSKIHAMDDFEDDVTDAARKRTVSTAETARQMA